jgi:hypothetical protein
MPLFLEALSSHNDVVSGRLAAVILPGKRKMKNRDRLAWILLVLVIGTSRAEPPKCGVGVVNITPEKGVPMAGYYSERFADGVHDDLYAKAIVIEDRGAKAALVALDLITTSRWLIEESRKEIELVTGIPGSNVMISATHSHTGPILARMSQRYDLQGGKNDAATKYMELLPRRIAESVRKAAESRTPTAVSFAAGREENLTFNRRFHMTDGTVGWNPGKLNPKIIRPAGPTDPAVPVVVFNTLDGKPFAAYVNFAMHLDTVGGTQVSADYPYSLAKQLSAAKGDGMVTLFTIGTAGDLNHINVTSPTPQKGHAEASRIGTLLAANVLRSFEQLQPLGDGPLRVSRRIVKLPLPPIASGEIEKAKAVVDRMKDKTKPPFLDQVNAFKVLDVAGRLGQPWEVEVQVISLGSSIAWVSLPGEIFCDLGLAIKAGSPFRQTMVATLANGSIGYVPNRVAYPQGNYEVVSARCGAGSGEMLVDSALDQLRTLFRSVVDSHSSSGQQKKER